MPLVLAPGGDQFRYSQDLFVWGLLPYGCTVLRKSGDAYERPPKTPDIIISHNPDDAADISFLRSYAGHAPLVAHLNCQLGYFGEQGQKNILEALSICEAVIVPGRKYGHKLKKEYQNARLLCADNGVTKRLFYPALKDEREFFRQEYRIPADKKIVGFVGRLIPSKGLSILEGICRRIHELDAYLLIQYPDWPSGNRDLMRHNAEALQSKNPGRIIVLPDTMPRLGNRPVRFFDVLLMPSHSELQPTVVLEALAAGVPVVATECTPFYSELFARGLPSQVLRIVKMSHRYKQGDSRITAVNLGELTQMERDCLKLIGAIKPYADHDRTQLSQWMTDAGFTDVAMYLRWMEIYQNCRLNFQTTGVALSKDVAKKSDRGSAK